MCNPGPYRCYLSASGAIYMPVAREPAIEMVKEKPRFEITSTLTVEPKCLTVSGHTQLGSRALYTRHAWTTLFLTNDVSGYG